MYRPHFNFSLYIFLGKIMTKWTKSSTKWKKCGIRNLTGLVVSKLPLNLISILQFSGRGEKYKRENLQFFLARRKRTETWKKRGKRKKTGSSSTISTGLWAVTYSQVLSHYCLTRELLPAVFPPWAGSLLFNQPGELRLLHVPHIDAKLSADTRST